MKEVISVVNIIKRIEVFGDSILKGIQINPSNARYRVDNHIDIETISSKHELVINNHSSFGCTITKGYEQLRKFLSKDPKCDAILMDYGGNDCDFDWKAVSEHPEEEHQPHTPMQRFVETYREIIHFLKGKGIRPVLTNLPPLSPERFFHWFCQGLNKANVLKWLGSVNTIYRFQENYSRTVEKIARESEVQVVDLRGAFLQHRRIDHLLCEDGTHPNTEGQNVITKAFLEFAESMAARHRIACAH